MINTMFNEVQDPSAGFVTSMQDAASKLMSVSDGMTPTYGAEMGLDSALTNG